MVNNVIHTDAGMHQIFGKLDLVVRRIGQFQHVGVTRKLKVHDLIARRTLRIPLVDHKTAGLCIPFDGFFKVADANARVKKLSCHGEIFFMLPTAASLEGSFCPPTAL